jgi:hypothetical protein
VSFRSGTTASFDLSKSIYMSRLKHPLDNPVLADELRRSRFQGNSEIYGLGIRIGFVPSTGIISGCESNASQHGGCSRTDAQHLRHRSGDSSLCPVFRSRRSVCLLCRCCDTLSPFYGSLAGPWPSLLKTDEPRKLIRFSWLRIIAILVCAIFFGHAAWFWGSRL